MRFFPGPKSCNRENPLHQLLFTITNKEGQNCLPFFFHAEIWTLDFELVLNKHVIFWRTGWENDGKTFFGIFLHFINIPWWEDDESEELDDEPNDPDAEPDTAEEEADAEDWRLLWFSCCMAAGFSSAIIKKKNNYKYV